MVALVLNLALATWLFVSAFLVPQSAATSWSAPFGATRLVTNPSGPGA